MKQLCATLSLFIFTVVLIAQDDMTIKTQPGVMVTVDSKQLNSKWVNVYDDLQMKVSKEGWAVFCSVKAGKYKIAWYSCDKDKSGEPNYVTIVVSGSAPIPNGGDLLKSLKTAYAKDTDPNKKWLLLLQALYEEWETAIVNEEKSKNVKTWKDLLTALQTSSTGLGFGKTEIVNLRTALASHFKSKFPTDLNKPVDNDAKKLASEVFREIQLALKEVSK